MVIECHMLPSDSVILAWHELDECISHKSDKPLPFLEQHPVSVPWHKLWDVYEGYTHRHCVIGLEPLSEIGSWKVGMSTSRFQKFLHFKVGCLESRMGI